jgi:hypothetical protein
MRSSKRKKRKNLEFELPFKRKEGCETLSRKRSQRERNMYKI